MDESYHKHPVAGQDIGAALESYPLLAFHFLITSKRNTWSLVANCSLDFLHHVGVLKRMVLVYVHYREDGCSRGTGWGSLFLNFAYLLVVLFGE